MILNVETLDNNVAFNKDLVMQNDFESFIEWSCVSLAYYFAGDNTPLLAKLCCDA